jgi:AcrR family transcriptional regulator
MARKTARPRARRSAVPSGPTAPRDRRQRIVDAFMALLAEQRIEKIGLAEIAERSGVTLAELRQEFSSPLAMLAAFTKDIDQQVLSEINSEMDVETPRERLFEVLIRRIELLAPYKEAIRSLMRSARVDPPLALALNAMAVQSQQWMLTAAGISASGPKGMVRAQGLSLLFADVLRSWVNDDDPGIGRTLAKLDDQLGRGQRFSGMLDELCRIPAAAAAFGERLCAARSRQRRSDRAPV